MKVLVAQEFYFTLWKTNLCCKSMNNFHDLIWSISGDIWTCIRHTLKLSEISDKFKNWNNVICILNPTLKIAKCLLMHVFFEKIPKMRSTIEWEALSILTWECLSHYENEPVSRENINIDFSSKIFYESNLNTFSHCKVKQNYILRKFDFSYSARHSRYLQTASLNTLGIHK